jgi:hypothetical protein
MNISSKHITVKKTARYFILGEAGPFTRQVWFVCHGYGFLGGDFLKNFEALNEKEHLVVASEGLHRFYLYGTGGKVGASWMTKEDRREFPLANEYRDEFVGNSGFSNTTKRFGTIESILMIPIFAFVEDRLSDAVVRKLLRESANPLHSGQAKFLKCDWPLHVCLLYFTNSRFPLWVF